MPETLTTTEERKMLDRIKKAVDLVDNKGMSPDDAIVKVAQDDRLQPGVVGMICRAYNTGRQLGQWRANTSIMDKLASFPLADPDKVLARLYPKAETKKEAMEKSAVADEYNYAPHWLPDERALEVSRRDLKPMVKAADGGACEKCGEYPCVCDGGRGQSQKQDEEASANKVGTDEWRMRRAYGEYERARNAVDDSRRHAQDTDDRLRGQVAGLVTYFKQAAYNRLPFAQVEHAARTYYGPAAVELLKVAYERAKLREPKSDKVAIQKLAFDLEDEPFTTIKRCVDLAEHLITARHWAKEASDLLEEVKATSLRPFVHKAASANQPSGRRILRLFEPAPEKRAFGLGTEIGAIAAGDILGGATLHGMGLEGSKREPTYEDVMADRMDEIDEIHRQAAKAMRRKRADDEGSEKQGFLSGLAAGATISNAASNMMGSYPKTKADLIEDDWLDLESPEHQNELRKIKAHAMLNSILTDDEDPISGHDPDKVLSHFNEISKTAPRVADNAAILKPLLRKRLAGQTEPFEAKELVDIEKGLRDTKNVPPSNLKLSGVDSEKLLG